MVSTGAFATYPSLTGRVVFITGGASGIGADMVRAFDGQGAKVAFIDIQDAVAKGLTGDLGGRPLYRHCDITDLTALKSCIAEIGETFGPIGVLINNAANDDREEIDDITEAYWDRSQAINLRPHFFAAQAVRPQMCQLGGGSIINFSSISYRYGADKMLAYATAKAAIIGLTKALARGFGDDNIRVNAIEPGAVITERQRQLWYPTEQAVQGMVDRQIIKKILLGEEVARLALFLASDDSRMITKQSLVIDAGMS